MTIPFKGQRTYHSTTLTIRLATRSRSVDSDEETQGSPDYQESDESSSRTDTDNGDDDGQEGQGATNVTSRGHTTVLDDHNLIQFFTYYFNLHLAIHDRLILFVLFNLQMRLTSLTLLRTRIMVFQVLNELTLLERVTTATTVLHTIT